MDPFFGFLACAVWGLIYAAMFLVVVEIIVWGTNAVFEVKFPDRAHKLLRLIAALVFLAYLLMCFTGVVPQHFPRS